MSFLRKYLEHDSRKPLQIAFLFQSATVWPALESVYDAFQKDGRIEIKIILVRETVVESSQMINAEEFLRTRGYLYVSMEEIDWDIYQPHVVFIQFPYDASFHTPDMLSLKFLKRGIRIAYVPYGLEISDTEIGRRDHFHNMVVENSWRIYTGCQGIYKEYMKYCRNRQAVRLLGAPRWDGLFRKNWMPMKQNIKESAAGRRIVVWKLHFPKRIQEKGKLVLITPSLVEYIHFARTLEAMDAFFVVLPHPKMLRGVVPSDLQGDTISMGQARELLSILRNKSNTWIDEGLDYRPSLYHGDAIILDRSSVMVEAAMCDVPVLFMENLEYREPLTTPVAAVARSFYSGSTCKDMLKFLDMVLRGEDPNREQRIDVISRYFPLADGKCGIRVKEDIVKSISEEGECRVPRVVLYGTGSVCNYYLEKQDWIHAADFTVCAMSDSNPGKWGEVLHDIYVLPPDELRMLDYDAVVIMAEAYYFDIKKHLVYDLYLDERKIWRLDEFVCAWS